MAQYVEAFGHTIEFPDDMTKDQIASVIKSQALKISAKKNEYGLPTDGMSGFEKFAAGMGKSVYDTGYGLGQMVGLVSRDDVAQKRKEDAALMKTGAGKAGDIAGNLVQTVPLAFVPGANTVKGAALIGSIAGLAQPSESTSETLGNVGFGGAGGAGGIIGGRALASAYQFGSGLFRPLTQKGQNQIAAEVLQASATDATKAAQNAQNARAFVQGSNPTLGQVAKDPGLAQLERTLYNKPETQGPLARAYQSQFDARKQAIADLAGTPDYRQAIKDGRKVFAKEDYDAAIAQGIDKDMAGALQPQIESLLRRPTMQDIQKAAQRKAADAEVSLSQLGDVRGLHWMKEVLDDKIKAAVNPASPSHGDLNNLLTMKKDLMATLEQISPAYKTANDNFAKMSRNINASDVAADLQSRLYKNAEWGAGKEMGTTYQTELSKALNSIKRQTGQEKALADVMSTKDVATLEGIAKDLARKENAQNLGRAVGSPTMQNMLGQNLIDRIAGPLGMPQTFSQNVLANTITRPYSFVMQSAEPKISGLLAEALADPKLAAKLLKQAQVKSALQPYAQGAEKFLGIPGLLALEDR